MNLYELMQKLWHDDCGGIITVEYLMLGSVLTVGTVSGMTAMRDATVDEMRESGNTMRAIRQQHTPKGLSPQTSANQYSTSTSNAPTLQDQYYSSLRNQSGCVNGVCP